MSTLLLFLKMNKIIVKTTESNRIRIVLKYQMPFRCENWWCRPRVWLLPDLQVLYWCQYSWMRRLYTLELDICGWSPTYLPGWSIFFVCNLIIYCYDLEPCRMWRTPPEIWPQAESLRPLGFIFLVKSWWVGVLWRPGNLIVSQVACERIHLSEGSFKLTHLLRLFCETRLPIYQLAVRNPSFGDWGHSLCDLAHPVPVIRQLMNLQR